MNPSARPSPPHSISLPNRREFLGRSLLAAGALNWSGVSLVAAEANIAQSGSWRAAIIGHTGRGDYGHGLDVVFNDLPGVSVVAIADPVTSGREAAAKRSGALRQYGDYREMLAKEKPQLVSIAPRWSDQHHAMGMAALEASAHLYLEKPITTTLAEADELIALAGKRRLKIAVAHQMRLAPNIVHLKRKLSEGLIGDVVQIRSWGKQDNRAGGEDMLVLGTHLFDMMRHLVGDASWCSARILHEGREFTKADARTVKEQIGLVGGTEIEAQFSFANGLLATFTSRAALRDTVAHWGMELIGSKGVVRILMDVFPQVFLLESGKWTAQGKTDRWALLKDDPTVNFTAEQRGFGPANRRVVDDWLNAIRADREPSCSGRDAMRALEMVMAVYQAGLTGMRAPLPLPSRSHPLK
ncbi:MAG: Gfo/Idh/MocA family oxidoreductase [Verrucomicrobia bacterium]|nr:Gfo/Idh/MocA family oxidoreductase [Verrucomicrobiota bacterium]